MARYDAGWGGFPGGARGRPYDSGWERGAFRQDPWGRGGHDRDWSPAESGRSAGAGIYGPERYGLGPYHARLRTRRRADDEIRADVEDALFYDTWVDAEAITVEVRDGVVLLRGELPSYEEVRYATDDAWDVDGVLGVRSELTVRER